LVERCTDRSKRDRSCRKPDQSTVSRLWLVNGIGIFMAELLDNLSDPVMFLVDDGFSDDAL
jgi:hypothetical protein